MNKLIIAALSIVGLVVSSSVFAGQAYDEFVQPRVDEQKEKLAQYKPPESFLKVEVSGEAPAEDAGADSGSSDPSPLLGDGDDGGYSGGSDEDNTWQ